MTFMRHVNKDAKKSKGAEPLWFPKIFPGFEEMIRDEKILGKFLRLRPVRIIIDIESFALLHSRRATQCLNKGTRVSPI